MQLNFIVLTPTPISLFKARLLIYLDEANSVRKLASALRYNEGVRLLANRPSELRVLVLVIVIKYCPVGAYPLIGRSDCLFVSPVGGVALLWR